MKLKAYAKINLTLDVTGKREDGYHLLDTVMQSVDVYDEITLLREEAPGVRLMCNHHYLPTNEKNTAYRAAVRFFEACGLSAEGLSISIDKRIPSRAGMGGGSADAAAVLRGLNEMYQQGLSLEALSEMGTKIGADVPFCVMGGTARCRGIGEQLEPVVPLPDCHLLICKPPAGMSTPRAFALMDRYPSSSRRATPKMLQALEAGSLPMVAKALGNRFDETMRLVQVRDIKKRMLSSGALGSMMTGSGSAVYGIFDTREKAENAAELLQERGELFLSRPCTGEEVRSATEN